jgi:hypothetical protein
MAMNVMRTTRYRAEQADRRDLGSRIEQRSVVRE